MKKYCTMFAFEDKDQEELHCTHKFLGELTDAEIKAVVVILDYYFKKNPFKSFKVKFNKEEMFGEDKDIRVLATNESLEKFLPELKKLLDLFRDDDFDYNPHVTTTEEDITKPFDRYLLVTDGVVVKEYGEE